MMQVVLLGSGNLATHLATVFSVNESIDLVQIYSRSIENALHLENLAPITNTIDNLIEADVFVIAVSDSAIQEVSQKLSAKKGLVVHTSGATSMEVIKNDNCGVFYPLQSFTAGKALTFENIPICIEAKQKKSFLLLESLAKSISKKVYAMNSEQRKQLHIAAVFVNNFVNYMYQIGEEICDANNVPFEVLLPIIKETAFKVSELTPKESQTGPAKRKDKKTLALHEKELNESQRKIYRILSEGISNNY